MTTENKFDPPDAEFRPKIDSLLFDPKSHPKFQNIEPSFVVHCTQVTINADFFLRISIEDKTFIFPVYAKFLSDNIPFFKSLLDSNWRKNLPDSDIYDVNIPGVTPNDVMVYLHLVYDTDRVFSDFCGFTDNYSNNEEDAAKEYWRNFKSMHDPNPWRDSAATKVCETCQTVHSQFFSKKTFLEKVYTFHTVRKLF